VKIRQEHADSAEVCTGAESAGTGSPRLLHTIATILKCASIDRSREEGSVVFKNLLSFIESGHLKIHEASRRTMDLTVFYIFCRYHASIVAR